jgi:hypothetical protein
MLGVVQQCSNVYYTKHFSSIIRKLNRNINETNNHELSD